MSAAILLVQLLVAATDGFWMSLPAVAPHAQLGLQEAGLRQGPVYLFTRPLWLPLLPSVGARVFLGSLTLQAQGFAWVGDGLIRTLLPGVESFDLDLQGIALAVGLDFRVGVATYRRVSTNQGATSFWILGGRFPHGLRLEVALSKSPAVVLSWTHQARRTYVDLGLLVSRARLLGHPLPVLPLLDVGWHWG